MRKPCRRELKGHLRLTHINRGLRGRRRSCARLEAFARTFEDEPFSEIRLTTKDEKRILEISQSTTDLWKTDFRAKNPVGLKISKTAINGITKRIIDTASILFFTRVPQKGEKSRRFEKIACEPRLGAGTERQSQRTKIPVRGLKHMAIRKNENGKRKSAYQNPRKGTETLTDSGFGDIGNNTSAYQNPRKGTETPIINPINNFFIIMSAYQNPRKGTETELRPETAIFGNATSEYQNPRR